MNLMFRRRDSTELSLILLTPQSYESEERNMMGIITPFPADIMTPFPSVCHYEMLLQALVRR